MLPHKKPPQRCSLRRFFIFACLGCLCSTLSGPGSLLEEHHPAQGGVRGHKQVHRPIGELGRRKPQNVTQPEPEESPPNPLGALQSPAEGLPQGILWMGAQAVPHRQKDTVEPEGKQRRRHRQKGCPHLRQGTQCGIGVCRRGVGIEDIEEIQAGNGGHNPRQPHQNAQHKLHRHSLSQALGLAEPLKHPEHTQLCAAPQHTPILLHRPQTQRGQEDKKEGIDQQKHQDLMIGHGNGQHRLGQIHPKEDAEALRVKVNPAGRIPILREFGQSIGQRPAAEDAQAIESQLHTDQQEGHPHADRVHHQTFGQEFHLPASRQVLFHTFFLSAAGIRVHTARHPPGSPEPPYPGCDTHWCSPAWCPLTCRSHRGSDTPSPCTRRRGSH